MERLCSRVRKGERGEKGGGEHGKGDEGLLCLPPWTKNRKNTSFSRVANKGQFHVCYRPVLPPSLCCLTCWALCVPLRDQHSAKPLIKKNNSSH